MKTWLWVLPNPHRWPVAPKEEVSLKGGQVTHDLYEGEDRLNHLAAGSSKRFSFFEKRNMSLKTGNLHFLSLIILIGFTWHEKEARRGHLATDAVNGEFNRFRCFASFLKFGNAALPCIPHWSFFFSFEKEFFFVLRPGNESHPKRNESRQSKGCKTKRTETTKKCKHKKNMPFRSWKKTHQTPTSKNDRAKNNDVRLAPGPRSTLHSWWPCSLWQKDIQKNFPSFLLHKSL